MRLAHWLCDHILSVCLTDSLSDILLIRDSVTAVITHTLPLITAQCVFVCVCVVFPYTHTHTNTHRHARTHSDTMVPLAPCVLVLQDKP